jgi:two-component system, LuxR family, response regulator FixJ
MPDSPMGETHRIYVIDDDEAVRDSLVFQLEAAGFEVQSFASAGAFLEVAPTAPPGCIISDVQMPGIDGMELQKRLAEMQLPFPLIIITGHGDVSLAVRAMKAGAVDFIEKPFSEQEILSCINSAQSRFSEQQASAAAASSARDKLGLLTPREREIFDQLIRGKQNKVIGYDLNISPRTVEVHRARVFEKLEARNLSELVRLALTAGVSLNP